MKLFGSTKKFIDKTKNKSKVPSLKLVEVVSVYCSLVDNQCQQSLKYYKPLWKIDIMLIY